MEHYRHTAHTRFDIKYHPVWVTEYRKPILHGSVGTRVRELTRQICAEHEAEILKGHVSRDHIHLFVSCPPHVWPSALMQRVKAKTARKLLMGNRAVKHAVKMFCCGMGIAGGWGGSGDVGGV